MVKLLYRFEVLDYCPCFRETEETAVWKFSSEETSVDATQMFHVLLLLL